MPSIAPDAHTRRKGKATDSWITPKAIIDRFGPFDLDPCAHTQQPWPCAARQYTVNDNGLFQQWSGLVYMNPPYGTRTGTWLEKLADYGNGMALIFARTDTEMFQQFAWKRSTSLLFLNKRLYFHYPDGTRAKSNSGGPSVLIAYGEASDERIRRATDLGHYARTP